MKISTLIILFLLMPLMLFAQDVVDVISNEAFLKSLIDAVGSVKGASTLGVVLIAVQLIMQFLKTKWGGAAGKYRLLAITGLTLVGGVLAIMATSDVTFGVAIISSANLAALQVFLHQLYKQFLEKKG